MDREASQMIIYSCITNGYDEIPDEHYYDPDVKYVMFTDGTIKKKGPWEFREIPCDHPCLRRRSAYVKINPHKVFPYGTKTVWLDGCYVMTPEYVKKCKEYLSGHRFTIMRHCEKFNYYEEILESFLPSMCTFDEAIEISQTIKDLGYNFKEYCSPVLASIWRVLDQDMYNFGDLWWKYSLIGTNRDQISFDTARQLEQTELNIIEDGWIRKEEYRVNGQKLYNHYPGSCGILFDSRGKKYRKKLHPQNGHRQQWRQKKELLNALRPITGLHPIIARFNFDEFVDRNVLQPKLPIQN